MYTLYKPSGKFSPLALLYYVGAGLLLFPVFAFLYAYAIWYCPFVYVNFIITLVFGAAMGGTLGYIVEKAKVRNPYIAVFFAVASAAFAYYVHWVVWVDLALNAGQVIGDDRIGSIAISNVAIDQLVFLFMNPYETRNFIREINQVGVWGLAGASDTANGGLLSFFWLLEAAIIFWLAHKLGTEKSKKPFSEKTHAWLPSRGLATLEFTKEPVKLFQSLLKGNMSVLEPMKKSNGLESHTAVTLYSSTEDECFLTFTNRTAKIEKGKIDFTDKEFITALKADDALLKLITSKPMAEDSTESPNTTAQHEESELPLYDSSKTVTIANLLQVPASKRNDFWHSEFNAAIVNASFASGTPQVVEGPDGFPYFKLQMPESKKPFNPFSLLSIREHVLTNGYGVALSVDGNQIVWSIPHGAMVNLHLYGELFSTPDQTGLAETEVLEKETTVLTGQPSEEYLPSTTRAVLKDFLNAQGISDPKVVLMMREKSEASTSELVFNIYAEDFETDEQFVALMHRLRWFLPQHYVVTALEKKVGETQEMSPL